MKRLLFALLLSVPVLANAEPKYKDCVLKEHNLIERDYYTCWTSNPLKAITTRTDLHGSADFFLLIGGASIQAEWAVRYAEVDDDGFTQFRQVSYSQIKVKEYDGEPCVKRHVTIGDDGREYHWFTDDNTLYFFLPKGTIKTEYNLDLNK